MNNHYVDLHVHSTRSDGTLTPTQLVEMAKKKGLRAFALTDHDSVSGIEEAMHAAQDTGIEVVPGIEFSTEYHGHDIHIVGLYYDWKDPDFQEQVKVFTEERVRRNQKMCARMAADGIPITYEALAAENPGSSITRANIGRFLMEHHVVYSIKEAFDKYIGDGCPYFIPREKISPAQAVQFTRKYHGIPILAHPFQYDLGGELVSMAQLEALAAEGSRADGRALSTSEADDGSLGFVAAADANAAGDCPAAGGTGVSGRSVRSNYDLSAEHTEKITRVTTGLVQLIEELKEAGLVGIEAYYCRHTPAMSEQVRLLARRYGLLLSGGSDFHGENKPGLEMGTGYGHLHVPEELLIRMKHYLHYVNDQTKVFFCDFDGTLGNSAKEISPLTKKALDNFIARGKGTVFTSPEDVDFIVPETADGNIFVLSSGRAMSDVKNLDRRLRLGYPHTYLSGYNGAEIYSCDTGVTFMRKTLPLKTVRRVLELAAESDIYCQTYDGDDIVVQSAEDAGVAPARDLTPEELAARKNGEKPMPLSPENPASQGMLDPAVPEDADIRLGKTERRELEASDAQEDNQLVSAPPSKTGAPVRHLQRETAYYTTYVKMPIRLEKDIPASLHEEPCKCLVIHLENPQDHKIEAFMERLHKEFGDNVTLVKSNPYYLEIDAKGATKGLALEWLCRYLGVNTARSVSAGDAPNDIPMIRAAGCGIAMCNGVATDPKIGEAADIITKEDNDHDGLAPILDTL